MTFPVYRDRQDRVQRLDQSDAWPLERTCDLRRSRAKAAGSIVEWRAGDRPTP